MIETTEEIIKEMFMIMRESCYNGVRMGWDVDQCIKFGVDDILYDFADYGEPFERYGLTEEEVMNLLIDNNIIEITKDWLHGDPESDMMSVTAHEGDSFSVQDGHGDHVFF